MQELRLQHAECVQELKKTHKLLMLQEIINKDYKNEVENLNKKLDAVRNEYGRPDFSLIMSQNYAWKKVLGYSMPALVRLLTWRPSCGIFCILR